ncbi:MAG: PEP-CTERM sorting domain-containing protein [Chromatiaceae bacterium]|nr:PEP-CTERM sorting domain-containing protein [Chromatiaceae bacterium]
MVPDLRRIVGLCNENREKIWTALPLSQKLLYSLITVCLLQASAASATLPSETITFDEAISGVPFFNFDSSDADSDTDVVFSTTDPFGFNTTGPGPFQLYINEPGLEGSTGADPDLRVDFLQGAVSMIEVGFALIQDGQATFTAFNQAGEVVGSQTLAGEYFDLGLGDGTTSDFPENRLSVALSGTAVYGEFNFVLNDFGGGTIPAVAEVDGRYIIDNFTFTPAGEEIIADFDGALPENPILPGEIILGPNNVPEFVFEFPIDENGIGGMFPIFIDPVVAVGYEYAVISGPNYASVLIPTALPNGDDEFLLSVPGFGDFVLNAGTPFDLTALNALGIDEFTITGIDTSELLDPNDPYAFVTGLTYVSGGVSNMTMTPITQNVPTSGNVPEPSALALLAFAAFGIGRRRRSREG